MRSTFAALACLAVLASCSPREGTAPAIQSVPVAIALLEETGRRCDELGRLVAARWQASAPLTGSVLEVQGVVGFIVRQAGVRTSQGIAILQQEAELRINDLEGQRDPKAPLLRAFQRKAREHCSAVTGPRVESLAAYTQDLELKQADRDLALEEAREGTAPPSVEGNGQIAKIYNRIAEIREPAPPAPAKFERMPPPAAAPPKPQEIETPLGTSDMAAALKGLEAMLRGMAKSGGATASNNTLYLDRWSCVRSGGSIKVRGWVANPSFRPMELGRVAVTFTTATGDLIETREGYFDSTHLEPLTSTGFSFDVADSSTIADCTVSFTDKKGQGLTITGNLVTRQGV
jgi:hypothetical protein